jgi:hypothetical protein
MTNREFVLKLFTLAVAYETYAQDYRAEVDRWQDAVDSVAWCDANDHEHDDLLAQRYDTAVHELLFALERYDSACEARDGCLAHIADTVREAAAHVMND